MKTSAYGIFMPRREWWGRLRLVQRFYLGRILRAPFCGPEARGSLFDLSFISFPRYARTKRKHLRTLFLGSRG